MEEEGFADILRRLSTFMIADSDAEHLELDQEVMDDAAHAMGFKLLLRKNYSGQGNFFSLLESHFRSSLGTISLSCSSSS